MAYIVGLRRLWYACDSHSKLSDCVSETCITIFVQNVVVLTKLTENLECFVVIVWLCVIGCLLAVMCCV